MCRIQGNVFPERQDRLHWRLVSQFNRCHIYTDGLFFRDTVASVGIITTRSLPFVSSNSAIRIFRHALSLDEVSPFTNVISAGSKQTSEAL